MKPSWHHTNTLALPLALLVLLPFLFACWFHLEQFSIRREMQEKLKGRETETLRLPRESLVWYKPGKEILVNGRLFDVLRITPDGSQLLVYGLFDPKETQLQMKAIRLLHRQQEEKEGSLSILSKLLQQICALPEQHQLTNIPATLPSAFSIITTVVLPDRALPVTGPPPRML